MNILLTDSTRGIGAATLAALTAAGAIVSGHGNRDAPDTISVDLTLLLHAKSPIIDIMLNDINGLTVCGYQISSAFSSLEPVCNSAIKSAGPSFF